MARGAGSVGFMVGAPIDCVVGKGWSVEGFCCAKLRALFGVEGSFCSAISRASGEVAEGFNKEGIGVEDFGAEGAGILIAMT